MFMLLISQRFLINVIITVKSNIFIQISLPFSCVSMPLLLSKYMSLLMFFSFNYFWNQIPMIKHFHPGTMKKKGGITQEEQVMV